jgi:putative acetyltransferase
MPETSLLQPEKVSEAKRVIYTVAYDIFHDRETLDETIAYYEANWPLVDIDNFQFGYFENGGTFLVMKDGDRIIGTGALRRLEDDVGEIKRLWLLQEYQGQGLGYRMMMQLLAVAKDKGYRKIRLETSRTYQARAYAFYRRLGFYDIPRFGDDPDDVALEMII